MSRNYVIIHADMNRIEQMRSSLCHHSDLVCVGTSTHAETAIELILNSKPELVFLGVTKESYPGSISFSFISELHRYLTKIPEIVIVSEDPSLALTALHYDVRDMLLLPLTNVDIVKLLHRIDKRNSKQTSLESVISVGPHSEVNNNNDSVQNEFLNENKIDSAIQEIKHELSRLEEVFRQKLSESHLTTSTTRDISQFQEMIDVRFNAIESKLERFDGSVTAIPNSISKLSKPEVICVKSYGDYRFIPLDEIAFLKADNNSTDITMKNGEVIIAFKPLKFFEENLPKSFYRIHNSYIVNQMYVNRIHTGNALCYIKDSKAQIPFSKGFKDKVDQLIQLFLGSETLDS